MEFEFYCCRQVIYYSRGLKHAACELWQRLQGNHFCDEYFPQIIMFNKFVPCPFHTFTVAVLSAIYPPSTNKQTILRSEENILGPLQEREESLTFSMFPHHYQMWQSRFNSNTMEKLLKPHWHFLCLGMLQAPGNNSSLLLKERYLLEGMAPWGLILILFWIYPS